MKEEIMDDFEINNLRDARKKRQMIRKVDEKMEEKMEDIMEKIT